jgi:uncharacterized membrane protein
MKNTFNISRRNLTLKTITVGFAVIAAHLLTNNSFAQTYTWDPQADGRVYLTCPDIQPAQWPSNSLWSQSLQMSPNCDNTAQVVSAPSHWTPAPPAGFYPGGPGAVGVDVVLGAPANTVCDAIVTLNSLTIKTNGGVIGFGGNVNVTANAFDFQDDGNFGSGGGLLTGTAYQYLGASVMMIAASLAFETRTVVINGQLIFAMIWLVFVLSIGAIFLLMVMIREGEMSKVASLFYLVPAVTAVIAWALFGEQLNLVQIAGMAVATLGVGLATAQPPTRARASR